MILLQKFINVVKVWRGPTLIGSIEQGEEPYQFFGKSQRPSSSDRKLKINKLEYIPHCLQDAEQCAKSMAITARYEFVKVMRGGIEVCRVFGDGKVQEHILAEYVQDRSQEEYFHQWREAKRKEFKEEVEQAGKDALDAMRLPDG